MEEGELAPDAADAPNAAAAAATPRSGDAASAAARATPTTGPPPHPPPPSMPPFGGRGSGGPYTPYSGGPPPPPRPPGDWGPPGFASGPAPPPPPPPPHSASRSGGAAAGRPPPPPPPPPHPAAAAAAAAKSDQRPGDENREVAELEAELQRLTGRWAAFQEVRAGFDAACADLRAAIKRLDKLLRRVRVRSVGGAVEGGVCGWPSGCPWRFATLPLITNTHGHHNATASAAATTARQARRRLAVPAVRRGVAAAARRPQARARALRHGVSWVWGARARAHGRRAEQEGQGFRREARDRATAALQQRIANGN